MFSLNRNLGKLAAGAAAVLAFAHPTGASAADCTALANTLNTWFTTQPQGPGNYYVLARAVLLRSDGAYGAYMEGDTFGRVPGNAEPLVYHGATLKAPATIYDAPAAPAGGPHGFNSFFSDRRYSDPTCSGFCADYPFAAHATDRTGMSIALQGRTYVYGHVAFPTFPGDVTFTNYTWGNAHSYMLSNQCTVNPSGTGGMLYGTMTIPTGTALIGVSLNEYFAPNIIPNRRGRKPAAAPAFGGTPQKH